MHRHFSNFVVCWFFIKINFFNDSFRNTIRVSKKFGSWVIRPVILSDLIWVQIVCKIAWAKKVWGWKVSVFCFSARPFNSLFKLLICLCTSQLLPCPQPLSRAGDSRANVLCFYFSIVPIVQRIFLMSGIWYTKANIGRCNVKHAMVLSACCPRSVGVI